MYVTESHVCTDRTEQLLTSGEDAECAVTRDSLSQQWKKYLVFVCNSSCQVNIEYFPLECFGVEVLKWKYLSECQNGT